MRITRITIENHAAVPNVDVEVRAHLVIVGPNESGKTSLLRLLDAVISSSQSQLYSRIDKTSLRDSGVPLTATVEFGEFTTDDKTAFADWIHVPKNPAEPSRLKLVLKATPDPNSDDITIERGFHKTGLPLRSTWSQLQQLGWAYLPANRSPDRELGQGKSSAVRQLLRAVELGESQAKIGAAIEALHSTIADAGALKELRKSLGAALTELLPRVVSESDVVLKLPSSDEGNPLSDVDVQINEVGSARSLRHQSDGVRAMSTIALQLLTKRYARMVAVDEPEIHLHPRGQAKLGRLLASAPGQRIVATHSPAVLARFSPTSVLAFSPVGGGCRQLSKEPFTSDPKVAEHWWTTATLEPLTSRAVILVEGVADRVIVEGVAVGLDVDLDRLGITVTEVNGAGSFKHAIQLFGPGGFDIPVFGLVDENEAAIPAKALNVDVQDLGNKDFWVCQADLEDECVKRLGPAEHARLLVASGHYREAEILSGNSASDLSNLNIATYAAWTRERKVRVAVALALQLTRAHAQALGPISDVLTAAASAGR